MRNFLAAGILWIQYRDKTSRRRDLFKNAELIRALTFEYGAFFTVNDHADIAAAVRADGLHLGQEDLPIRAARKVFRHGVIGVSTHSKDEALQAVAAGADYIGAGPVYPTTTKNAGPPRGVEALAELKEIVTIPIIAIGGITPERCAELANAGSSGVGVASALCGPAADPPDHWLKSIEVFPSLELRSMPSA